MAEKSILWTTGATGDGASPYTQAESIRWRRQEMVADDTLEGVLKGYENDLEVTGAATPIQIDTGAAIVYGFSYWNTAAVNKTISTPAGNTRFDRVVLQADWTAQTIRIAVLGGVEGAGVPPAVTQTDGVAWEITLATFSITTGGTITVTDARSFLHPNIAVDENMIDAAVAGDGLAGGDGSVLSVNVDDATIEISADTLQVKDAGVDSDAIASSIAGDGLQGGSGSALAVDVSDFAGNGLKDDGAENLDVEPADFAGTGLEDDGADNLRISAAAAGNGLKGGAGSALAIEPADFAGTNLEDDGADNLRIAASAAGNGLTGGGASVLSVGVDGTTIEISGDVLQLRASGHGPSQHANRTRRFWASLIYPRNPGGTAPIIGSNSYVYWGFPLESHEDTHMGGNFFVPDDFVSGMTITPVIVSQNAGNIVATLNAQYGAVGQAYNAHTDSWGPSTLAVTANVFQALTSLSLASVAKGDIVTFRLFRDGDHGSDTLTDAWGVGVLVEYTGDE